MRDVWNRRGLLKIARSTRLMLRLMLSEAVDTADEDVVEEEDNDNDDDRR